MILLRVAWLRDYMGAARHLPRVRGSVTICFIGAIVHYLRFFNYLNLLFLFDSVVFIILVYGIFACLLVHFQIFVMAGARDDSL